MSVLKIAVIGAGNLGRRHLEAVLALEDESEVFVVDPSEASLSLAREGLNGNYPAGAEETTRFLTDASQLPDRLDYVINATTSRFRFDSICEILDKRSVDFMLLEKVLFQKLSEYSDATALLHSNKVKTWVHTPRRAYPIYQNLHEKYSAQRLMSLEVEGMRGLGGNAIHMLDLVAFFGSESEAISIDSSGLEDDLLGNDRTGYVEVGGEIKGVLGAVRFSLKAANSDSPNLKFRFTFEEGTVEVDEKNCNFQEFDRDGALANEAEFRVPYVSEMGTKIASDILSGGSCDLPNFEQSAVLHHALILALIERYESNHPNLKDHFPIT